MDVTIIISVVMAFVLAVLAVGSPFTRREKHAADAEARTHYDSDRLFKRPPNEGGLL